MSVYLLSVCLKCICELSICLSINPLLDVSLAIWTSLIRPFKKLQLLCRSLSSCYCHYHHIADAGVNLRLIRRSARKEPASQEIGRNKLRPSSSHGQQNYLIAYFSMKNARHEFRHPQNNFKVCNLHPKSDRNACFIECHSSMTDLYKRYL